MGFMLAQPIATWEAVMASHLESVAAELGHIGTGLDKVTSLAAEADEHLRRSIEAGARGGFSAMVVSLRAAREQLGQVRSALGAVRSDVSSANSTVTSAPKEIDAGQMITLLSPLIPVRTRTLAMHGRSRWRTGVLWRNR
jgi:hypothetical protein